MSRILWHDVQYAIRGVVRAPGMAFIAIALLALGIGANTAMFSVVDAAIFKPLPYNHPEQLVQLLDVRDPGTADELELEASGWGLIDRWRAERSIFSAGVTFGTSRSVSYSGTGYVGIPIVGRLSAELLSLLGVQPTLGRWFTPDEARAATPLILLTDAFWKGAFNADRAIVGKTIALDNHSYTVVGVMPATFSWGVSSPSVIGWLPFDESSERSKPHSTAGGTIFRLREGLSFDDARRQVQTIAAKNVVTLRGSTFSASIDPIDYREKFTSTRVALMALLTAVGCVLLIACANVANLLFARALMRRRELAVRSALGATRGRLISQLLTESFVLTSLGGAIGLAIAAWSVESIPRLIPITMWQAFSANPMTIDWRVLGWCGAAVVITTLVCGLIPALRASRADVVATLEGSTRIAGEALGGKRLRQGLQAIEIALTLVLLTGTTLLASSLGKMMWSDPGYSLDHLVTTGYISAPLPRYQSEESLQAFVDSLLAGIRLVPAVRGVAIGEPPPLGFGAAFIPSGEHDAIPAAPTVSAYVVGPGYFDVTGVHLLRGREFTADDRVGSPPVGIIDADTARRFWPNEEAIGKAFRYSRLANPSSPSVTIVGIAGHVKSKSFASPTGTTQIYLPVAQSRLNIVRGLVMRVDGDPEITFSAVRQILAGLDPEVRMSHPLVVSEMYGGAYIQPRFYLVVVSLFAGLALITCAVGLFGILNYAVGQRTREIGVRLALGADARGIRLLVVGEALAPVVAGLAGGLAGAFLLTRYLASLLYGVTPHDALAYAAAVGLLLLVAAVAALLPVHRATRVDPVVALRTE